MLALFIYHFNIYGGRTSKGSVCTARSLVFDLSDEMRDPREFSNALISDPKRNPRELQGLKPPVCGLVMSRLKPRPTKIIYVLSCSLDRKQLAEKPRLAAGFVQAKMFVG